MYRGCGDGSRAEGPGVDYFEFRWAYFFLDATFVNSSWWPAPALHAAFRAKYEAVPSAAAVGMGNIDTDTWMEVAAGVVALCRADTSGSYVLPTFFTGEGRLPGHISGYTKLGEDPVCDPPHLYCMRGGMG